LEKALIIAAGKGERIKCISKEKPKPLIKLLGLTLIERVILSLKEAGISEVFIVVGYKKEKIVEFFGDGRRYGLRINYIENDEFQRGNGISLLKAKNYLKEKFLLLMSDHIFDEEAIKRVSNFELGDFEIGIVVDRNYPNFIDLGDATKVLVKDGMVVDIGKKIENYNGIDCGIFIVRDTAFKYFEEALSKGEDTLSGMMKEIAIRNKLKAIDFEGKFWIDIDTEKELKTAKKLLLKNLFKETDGPISRYINRPISTKITELLVNLPISPNLMTVISFIISILSSILFLKGNKFYFLIAGIIAQFSSIVDGCDGEIARLKFKKTDFGAWLDSVLDRYSDFFLILGITIGYSIYKGEFSISTFLIGYFAMFGSFMNSYTAVRLDQIIEKKGIKGIRFGRDIRIFLIMIGSILNKLKLLLLILAIITNFISVKRIFFLKKEI